MKQWRLITDDEQNEYAKNIKLKLNEKLIYYTKTREIRKIQNYDYEDIELFDRCDWLCAEKINLKIPKQEKPRIPQWTIVTVKQGKYGRYQINRWPMSWNSQKAAERIIREQEESYPKQPYKLKAVLRDSPEHYEARGWI